MTYFNHTSNKNLTKTAKRLALAGLGVAFSVSAFAAGIVGEWKTYEDGKPRGIVTITESGGVYTGKVTGALIPQAEKYIGRTVIVGLKDEGGGKFGGGKITDPVNGKTYSLTATLEGDTLKLRGYLGVSALGRSQTWQRK